ncbi:MAG: tRNA-binding protein [Candidatus Bathyarchaeia archaeon]
MYVDFKTFEKLDIRIGKVLEAERIEGYKKIMKLKVDVGDKKLDIIAGGAQFYEPEYFINKNVVVLTNLKPKTLAGIKSMGMLLAADLNGKPIWLTVDQEVPPGTRVR